MLRRERSRRVERIAESFSERLYRLLRIQNRLLKLNDSEMSELREAMEDLWVVEDVCDLKQRVGDLWERWEQERDACELEEFKGYFLVPARTKASQN